jgi:hypothetical protein
VKTPRLATTANLIANCSPPSHPHSILLVLLLPYLPHQPLEPLGASHQFLFGRGGAALNVYMLIFGRILLGIGIGFASQVLTFYGLLFELDDGKTFVLKSTMFL